MKPSQAVKPGQPVEDSEDKEEDSEVEERLVKTRKGKGKLLQLVHHISPHDLLYSSSNKEGGS